MKRKEGGRDWEREMGKKRGREIAHELCLKPTFFFTAQNVYFLAKFNVWVHLATLDSLDHGQLQNRQCESVTQNRFGKYFSLAA